jgi:hypothetical protein
MFARNRGQSVVRSRGYQSVYQLGILILASDRGQGEHTHAFQRRSERTPDYSTKFATASTKNCAVTVAPWPHSAGRCLATIPSLSSAEAAQATTTARVNMGERPRRVARVTMRLGPCRRTSASAMTRLTGGIRSSGRIGACIDTKPFPRCFGECACGHTLPRHAGRRLFRPAHLPTILVVRCGFGNTLSRQCAT